MKTMKKILSLVMGLVMALAMSVTAFAAGENYSITIENQAPNHTYEAYQIFAGDLTVKDGNKILSNISWGSGVDLTKEVGDQTLEQVLGNKTAAEVAESLKDEAAVKAFAEKVAPYLNANSFATSNPSDGGYTISGLKAGYYLVKDKDNSLMDKNDFYTAYIMRVVDNVTAEPKGDKPSLKKEIQDNDTNEWGVVGDNQIGDTVKFRTISTVPNNIKDYTKYDYIISDTMSEGLTSNVKTADDVTITVKGKTLSQDYYTVTANGNSFQVQINILQAINDGKMDAGDEIITSYTGVLNENAKVYDDGKQENSAHLEYSNNPNDTSNKGQTPESKVYDWTFKMNVNKVDKNQNPLEGAKFVLSKNGKLNVDDMKCGEDGVPANTENLIGLVIDAEGNYRVATANDNKDKIVYTIDAGHPAIRGLDDATDYYLYETKAPEGYNLLSKPVQFKITAEYNEDGSKLLENYPTVTVDNGNPSTDLSTNVVNQSGAELPSTGGIGTTIFYVVGGLLVVGAGIVLVTKKRMGKAE